MNHYDSLIDVWRVTRRTKYRSEAPSYQEPKQGVLIIDMQPSFLKGIKSEKKAEIIRNQRNLLYTCINKRLPAVLIEYEGEGKTVPGIRNLWKTAPLRIHLIKTEDDSFESTNLAGKLRYYALENLIIAGINASACVKRTANGALDNGFGISTSEKLIADPPNSDYAAALYWYKAKGNYSLSLPELFQA
jgi:nicotinamidase-related amidase